VIQTPACRLDAFFKGATSNKENNSTPCVEYFPPALFTKLPTYVTHCQYFRSSAPFGFLAAKLDTPLLALHHALPVFTPHSSTRLDFQQLSLIPFRS
jgi:hypothetical protein